MALDRSLIKENILDGLRKDLSEMTDMEYGEFTKDLFDEINWDDRHKYVPLPKSFSLIPKEDPLLKGIYFTHNTNDLFGKFIFTDDRDGSDWYNERSIKVTICKLTYITKSSRFYYVDGLGFIYSDNYESLYNLADMIYPEEYFI